MKVSLPSMLAATVTTHIISPTLVFLNVLLLWAGSHPLQLAGATLLIDLLTALLGLLAALIGLSLVLRSFK